MNLSELIQMFRGMVPQVTLDAPCSVALTEDKTAIVGTVGKVVTGFGDKYEPTRLVTYCSPGIIEIDCQGHSLELSNVTLEHSAKKLGFLSGLVIKNAVGLKLTGVAVRGTSLTGIDLRNCSVVELNNVSATGNKYAGVTLSGCKHVKVGGCLFADNGETIPLNGYGIALQGSPQNAINENVVIMNCRAINNMRKGIDVHCGRDLWITNNYVRNIGDMGIYAVSESPAKNVGNVFIAENTIHNAATSGLALSCSGIAVGSSNDGRELPPDPGWCEVSKNVITSDPRNLGIAGIQVYMPERGPALKSLKICDNVIYQVGAPKKHYGIIVNNRVPPAGCDLPEIAELGIERNEITCLGECGAGILASHATRTVITDNQVSCTEAVYGIASQGAKSLAEARNRVTGRFSREAVYCGTRKA